MSDAFCQWTASQGYWGCAPWVNQVQDYGWIVGTGFTFGCAGSGRSEAGCVPSDAGAPNAVFIGSQADGDPLYQFEVFRPVNNSIYLIITLVYWLMLHLLVVTLMLMKHM